MTLQIKGSRMFGFLRHGRGLGLPAVVAGLMLIFGCGGTEQHDNADTVEQTVVRVGEDGRPVVTTSPITVAQQQAQIEARQRMIEQSELGDKASSAKVAGVFDAGCAASSLWLFDDTYLRGDQICFYGTDIVDLSAYFRWGTVVCDRFHCVPASTWAGAVRSYYAGVSGGRFYYYDPNHPHPDGDPWYAEEFAPWQRADVAGQYAQLSHTVYIR